MVHSKNHKRLQHNSSRLSYRNSISRANQGQKFTKKQLSKLTSLSKRRRYEVMITRLMYAKTVRTDRKIEYNVLQKIKDQIRNNNMPEDVLRHIKSFIPKSVLVKAKLNIANYVSMEDFAKKVLSIRTPNREDVFGRYYFHMVKRKVNIFEHIEKEQKIYSNPSLRFVKYKDEIFDIRSNKFLAKFKEYVENILMEFRVGPEKDMIIYDPTIHHNHRGLINYDLWWSAIPYDINDYLFKSYKVYQSIKKHNILEERERLESLLHRRKIFGHIWAMDHYRVPQRHRLNQEERLRMYSGMTAHGEGLLGAVWMLS